MTKLKQLRTFLDGVIAVQDSFGQAQQALDGLLGKSPRIQMDPGARNLPIIDVTGTERPTHGGMVVQHHDVKNIDQRVRHVIDMIQKGRDDPEFRRFAVQAASKKCGNKHCVAEGDYDNEVKAIFMACRARYRYIRDTFGKDLFQHPSRTLEFGGGDCDDASILISSALGAVGYPTKLRVIRTHKSNDWNHIYVMCGIPPGNPTKWVALDLSVGHKPPGWQPPKSMIAAVKDFPVP